VPKTRDYYDVLGVARNATKKEIQAAFRKLARECHPDAKPGDKEAEKRFKEISQAHTVLADTEKRKLYDAFGNDWQAARAAGAKPGQAPFGGGFGNGARVEYRDLDPEELNRIFGGQAAGERFGDIFGSIFGSARGGRAAAPRSMDAEAVVRVTLAEAYAGAARQVELPDGRRLEVKVPAGVAAGTILRVPGLRARVEVAPDATFRREGKDLHVQVPVALRTLLLGGEVEVPTLKGTRVTLTVKPDTQNGTRLRLRGLGMPDPGKGATGDLFAEVKARLPVPMDQSTRRWAEEMPG
jgi:DnaJ-class molecular chaperone